MSLVTDVQTLIDEANGWAFWTPSHLYDAVNASVLERWGVAPWELYGTPLVVEAGARTVDLPPEIMIPKFLHDNERAYFVCSDANLEQYAPDWRSAEPSIPQVFALTNYRTLLPHPIADDNYQYTLVGAGWPPEISDTNLDLTGLHPHLRESIVFKAASRLLAFTQPQLSDVWKRESDESFERYRKSVRNYFPHNIRHMRPSPNSKFGIANRGGVKQALGGF